MQDRGADPSKEEVLAAFAREGGNVSRAARRLTAASLCDAFPNTWDIANVRHGGRQPRVPR
jgi:hypothetical protein